MFFFSLQLKETVERIVAVDRAAAMIEDMMKQGPNFQFPLPNFPMTNGVQQVVMDCIAYALLLIHFFTINYFSIIQAGQSLSVCIYLGFDVDPSWNIAARIRGPNVGFSFHYYYYFYFKSHILLHLLSNLLEYCNTHFIIILACTYLFLLLSLLFSSFIIDNIHFKFMLILMKTRDSNG